MGFEIISLFKGYFLMTVYLPLNALWICTITYGWPFYGFTGAPQVLRYSVAKEVEAVSGRDVRLEMEVCSDPIPSKTTWDWGSLRVEAGQVSFLIYFCASLDSTFFFLQTTSKLHNDFSPYCKLPIFGSISKVYSFPS